MIYVLVLSEIFVIVPDSRFPILIGVGLDLFSFSKLGRLSL